MKLEVTVYPEPVEHEIDLGIDELRTLIGEAMLTAAAETTRDFLRLANRGGCWIKAIPDELIAELNDAQRRTVAVFLREQAERFEVKP